MTDKKMKQVVRIYVEKRPGFDTWAGELAEELRSLAGVSGLEKVRILHRYDFYNPGSRYYGVVKDRVFSDPATDTVCEGGLPEGEYSCISVEYLPGQFDARAEAASQAAALVLDRPAEPVFCAQTYLLYGELGEEDLDTVRSYLINPVDSREASEELPCNLESEVSPPRDVPIVGGFIGMSSGELHALKEKL
ncbi:MAG: phosphoribosylformylglycinamidine synthase, partial [Spirochaetaceae bacterium]